MIIPTWQVSKRIKHFVSTRQGGVSQPPFESFNLALHVEDDVSSVLENRRILQSILAIEQTPLWLDQRHTTNMVEWNGEALESLPIADAAWTSKPNTPVCVMTADCQPLLVTNKKETFVAAIHVGWQGLLDGIITKSILALPDKPENMTVLIGPSISQANFEVEADFVAKFVAKNSDNHAFFKRQSDIKYKADLVGISCLELQALGVNKITKSQRCTFENKTSFFSYRREGKTGRMVTVIWLDEN